jgi:hypothetical protein
MGARKFWGTVIVVALVILGAAWFFLGPTGRETVEAVHHTSDELTGKRAVDQGIPLREEARSISTDQKERLRGLGLERGAESGAK